MGRHKAGRARLRAVPGARGGQRLVAESAEVARARRSNAAVAERRRSLLESFADFRYEGLDLDEIEVLFAGSGANRAMLWRDCRMWEEDGCLTSTQPERNGKHHTRWEITGKGLAMVVIIRAGGIPATPDDFERWAEVQRALAVAGEHPSTAPDGPAVEPEPGPDELPLETFTAGPSLVVTPEPAPKSMGRYLAACGPVPTPEPEPEVEPEVATFGLDIDPAGAVLIVRVSEALYVAGVDPQPPHVLEELVKALVARFPGMRP